LVALTALLAGATSCNRVHTKNDLFWGAFFRAHDIKYKEDKREYWQTPEETKRLRTGDCEDKIILFLDELAKNGMKGRLIIGLRRIDAKEYHVWCEVKQEGKIYIADPTNFLFLPKSWEGFGEVEYIEFENEFTRGLKEKNGYD
jgi:hypothetical protein